MRCTMQSFATPVDQYSCSAAGPALPSLWIVLVKMVHGALRILAVKVSWQHLLALLGPLGGCVGAQQGPNLLTPDAAPAGNSARSRCLILHRNDRPYDAARSPFMIPAQLCLLARHMYLAPMLHEARSQMFRHLPCQYKE